MLDTASRLAEPVADLDLPQTPELRDLACANLVLLLGVAVREDPQCGYLPGVEAVADLHRPGEDPRVGDAIPCRAALDLEDARRERAVVVADSRRQQTRDPVHHVLHARPGER